MRQAGIVGWLLEREDGVLLGTLLGTLASIFASVATTVAVLAAIGQFDRSLSVALPIAILAPVLIAPLFFWVSLSLLVELDEARARLERISMLDTLTEVSNRRRFLELAEREFDSARRYHYPISLLVVDPDHLQDVNESYGYDSGDLVLKEVARACELTSRKGDLVARSGGEEFWILLTHCGPLEAETFASRLRVHVRSLIIDIGTCQITCTVSIGGVSMEGGESDLDAMMTLSSRALKRAKSGGRNRVELVSYPGSSAPEPQSVSLEDSG